ncbi:MAG: hypothetical protein ACR2QK_18860 [Acidimicrobiales bacterium]
MARRDLVRRLNLELSADERGEYDPDAIDTFIDWICEARDFDDQEARVTDVLDKLRRGRAGDEALGFDDEN